MIQRYCIYPKIAVVALIFSFVQCALIVPLEMIDDLVFQNKGFQPTGMFTALGFVIIYVIIYMVIIMNNRILLNNLCEFSTTTYKNYPVVKDKEFKIIPKDIKGATVCSVTETRDDSFQIRLM